jgi:superfamily II DNA/RNA helicase
LNAFEELGAEPLLSQKLLERTIRTPTSIQNLVIPLVLENNNIVFCSATGTGKTIAYLLPLLTLICKTTEDSALILAPTLELALQIKNETDALLKETYPNIRSALLTGSISKDKQIETLKKIKPRIIIGNTSRILQLAQEKKLRLSNIKYLVLDEADRLVSEEMYNETEELIYLLNKGRSEKYDFICCSATISEKNKSKLKTLLKDDFIYKETDTNDILQNYITHWAVWCETKEKLKYLKSFLAAVHAKKVLVFASRAEEITKISGYLQAHKVKAAALFSGMDKQERRDALDKFRRGSISVLVSSDLAARGLDIPDTKYVVSLNVNEESEIYIHRAGRTGRAGKKCIIVSIGSEVEMRRLAAIEKKLKITVYPKIIYSGRICSPEEFDQE